MMLAVRDEGLLWELFRVEGKKLGYGGRDRGSAARAAMGG